MPIALSEVDWARRSGANSVSGLALINAGGALHTCAGQSANLIPDSAYVRARMTAIFGNATKGHARCQPGARKVRARRSALCLDPAHDALRRIGQLLLHARARRRLVRHEQRKMAGRLADQGRFDDVASRRTRRKAGEGVAPLSTQPQYTDSRIGIISWAVWIGRGLEKVQSSSMPFRGDALQVVALRPTSRNRRGRPTPEMKRSSISAARLLG